MKDLNYYNPLTTVNESEQKTLEKMQLAFNAAIGKSNIAQNNMISSYMATNESRRLCHNECSKGWSTDANSWLSKIKTDTTPTTDTPAQGLEEVINSCKAGCDLKWPGTVLNPSGLGVVKTAGLYTSATGKDHEITHCNDLAPFAPQTNCVVSDYSWSSCSKDCGPGTKTGTRTVITAPQNGGKPCPVLSATKPCQDKPCPTDCEVSAFSGWSSCSKNCGPGTQTSTRTVTTAAQNGGKACPALSQSQSCNNGVCTSVRVSTGSFGGGAPVVDDYLCKNTPDGNGTIYNTAQSKAYGTSSDCGAHDQCMIEVTKDCRVEAHMQDRCKSARNWDDWSSWTKGVGGSASNHGCTSTIISESFVGGRKKGFLGGMQEGFTPLQGDFVKACEDAGTRDGKQIPGTTAPGNLLVKNRKQETESFNRLKSTQQQLKKSINQMQSKNLGANSLYKTQNIILLKKLASYEQAIHKLLKTGNNLDTLGAQQSDSLLRKNSVDLSYYSWLTLAISILGIAITKIK
jgi:hypothetical protein